MFIFKYILFLSLYIIFYFFLFFKFGILLLEVISTFLSIPLVVDLFLSFKSFSSSSSFFEKSLLIFLFILLLLKEKS